MASTVPLTARQHEVLVAIVEDYIATGEPVSSGAVARSSRIASGAASPATIRNEMAALVDAGLLEQPHTSAGRVPSALAFRVYVDSLQASGRVPLSGARMGGAAVDERREVNEMKARIGTSLMSVAGAGAEALLERSSQVLAMLSSGVGVAIGTPAAEDLLEHVHFSRLAPQRVLAVLVTRGGLVRDRILALAQDFSATELETASNLLNENFRGWSLESVRAELARRLEQERSAYRAMLSTAEALWSGAMPAGSEQMVFVEGVANLVGVREEPQRLREMLGALEAKKRLVELLNAYIDARQDTVRVVFDLERDFPAMAGLVLVAAPARVAGDRMATVGVIGSTRIDYASAMNAVGCVAGLFDRMLDPDTSAGSR